MINKSIVKKDILYFHSSKQLFDELYQEFKDEFRNGEILLGGSLYYHLLGMNVYRSPGDIDLIINHTNISLQRDVALFFDKIGDGINYIERIPAKHKQIGISRVIHHNSGIRIELSQGIFDGIYFKQINNYELCHFEQEKLIRNLFLYFRVYCKLYHIYKKENRKTLLQLYVYKIRKMYSNILMVVDYYKIKYNYIVDNHDISPFVARELNGSIGWTLTFRREGFDFV